MIQGWTVAPDGRVEELTVVHPMSGAHLPIYTAEYVLSDYGSGAVMGVPGHDERDRELAESKGLPVVQVLTELQDGDAEPRLMNSGAHDGQTCSEARQAIMDAAVAGEVRAQR